MVYIGNDEVQRGGVAVMMSAKEKGALMEWMPISKRIFSTILLKVQKTEGGTSICTNK